MTSPRIDVPTIGYGRETLLGFQPTLWYYPPGIVDHEAPTSVGVALNTLQAAPLVVGKETAFDKIGFRVITGAAGGLVRGALYRSTKTALGIVYPGALISGTDTGDLSTAANLSDVFSSFGEGGVDRTITLQAGLYWLAWNAGVAVANLFMQAIAQPAFGRASPGANPTGVWSIADAYTNFPHAVFPAGAALLNGQSAPLIRAAPV